METTRIADQLRRSITGPAWHGPSVLEIVGDVTPEESRARPLAASHTIGEIVAHVTTWMGAAIRALDSSDARPLDEVDWPTPGDWHESVARLRRTAIDLTERLGRVPDAALEANVRGNKDEFSRYFLLHGVAQHNTYHAGQLAILKKVLRSRE